MIKKGFYVSIAICAHFSIASAQNDKNGNVADGSNNVRFWESKLPGGDYMVALDKISSISMSTYHLKGMIVHEVNVETMGAALARFYTITVSNQNNTASAILERAKDIVNEGTQKVGTDVHTVVTKEYPITTHQKTIEFRLADKADLEELYKSLSKAWKSGRGRKITIK